MTERQRVEEALASHGAFERAGDEDAFDVTTTFEARVSVRETAAGSELLLAVRVPTIDAVVVGETVAPVVREGWLETFERRLEDVGGVTRGEPTPPTVRVDAEADEVVVETAVDASRPGVAAADAKAVVDYVEGTFVEGLIPGYEYREPAAGLLDRAQSAGEV